MTLARIGKPVIGSSFGTYVPKYTAENLALDLASGAATVLSSAGSNYRIALDSSNAQIVIGHKDAVYSSDPNAVVSPLAISTSTNFPALAITAGGILMGFNSSVDGKWHNGVSITSGGSASFSGAVNATSGNFADSITVAGVTLATIKANAAAGAAASSSLSAKLQSDSSYILSGTMSVTTFGGIRTGNVAWDVNGTVNAGTGIAITSKGIVGVSSNGVTFTLNGTSGAASFKGDISGSSGTFSGSLSTSGQVLATGTTTSSLGVDAAIVGYSSASAGVVGKGSSYGVYGNGPYGVYGQGSGAGSYGIYGVGNSYGVVASSPSVALRVEGAMQITSQALVTNLNADTLDGYHATSFPRFVSLGANSGYTVAGKAAYWAVFSVGGSSYNFLIGA